MVLGIAVILRTSISKGFHASNRHCTLLMVGENVGPSLLMNLWNMVCLHMFHIIAMHRMFGHTDVFYHHSHVTLVGTSQHLFAVHSIGLMSELCSFWYNVLVIVCFLHVSISIPQFLVGHKLCWYFTFVRGTR